MFKSEGEIVSRKRVTKRMKTLNIKSVIVKKAVVNRTILKDILFRTNRGIQYTSNDFETLLTTLESNIQTLKKAYPYDIASMESFNAVLKKKK